MRSLKSWSLLACAVACSAIAQAQVPAGYPADYKAIVDGAKKEAKWSSTRRPTPSWRRR